ncbi:MAG: hypothetical protein IJH37_06080 [Clostridia bacterium]|nr:hypothetical protein [Clostridia bacterium]
MNNEEKKIGSVEEAAENIETATEDTEKTVLIEEETTEAAAGSVEEAAEDQEKTVLIEEETTEAAASAEEAAEDPEKTVLIEEETTKAAEQADEAEPAVTENPVGYSNDEVSGAPQKAKKSTVGIIAAVALIIVAIAVVANMFFMNNKSKGGKYGGNYLDIDGTTAASIADSQGMEYADFLKMYDLPEDLPGETNGNATENLIPLKKFAELMGTDLDTLREQMGWDETFTEEMTIGEARDKTTLAKLVGEESLEQFKEAYELDDSVNGETLFGEIRAQMEQREKKRYDEQKAAEAAAADEKDAKKDDADAEEEQAEEEQAEEKQPDDKTDKKAE